MEKYFYTLKYLRLIPALFLLITYFDVNPGYYEFLRNIVFIVGIYTVYEIERRNFILGKFTGKYDFDPFSKFFSISIIIVTVIYNPILPMNINDSSEWQSTNLLSALLFIVSIIIDGISEKMGKQRAAIIAYEKDTYYFVQAAKEEEIKGIEKLSKLIENKKPTNIDVLQTNFQTAIELYSKAIEDTADIGDYYFQRGLLAIALRANETITNPKEDFKKSLELGYDNELINLYIGLVLFYEAIKCGDQAANRFNEARSYFDKQILINNHKLAYFMRVCSILNSDQQNFDSCEDELFEDISNSQNIIDLFRINKNDPLNSIRKLIGRWSLKYPLTDIIWNFSDLRKPLGYLAYKDIFKQTS